jgi:hypothetical protein
VTARRELAIFEVNLSIMELVAGFLLWIGDVLGVKWIKEERALLKKLAKAITFLLVGIFVVVLYFAITY